jgi:hypothetical protein
MSFEAEDLRPAVINPPTGVAPDQMNLPVKEFVGYDEAAAKAAKAQASSPEPKQEDKGVDAAKASAAADPSAAPAEPEKPVELSSKLSTIARAEQAQRRREQSLKQREAALEAGTADVKRYADLKSRIASGDYSALDELGADYNKYSEYLISKTNAEKPEEQRVRKVESELEKFRKEQEDKTVREYEANQSLWKKEIAKTVSENAEFSTIKELGAEDAVLRHVNDSFEEDGTELSVEEAAKEVEEALLARAEKFASVTKLKGKAPEKVLGPPKTGVKTITQETTVTSEKKPSGKPFYQMSESEQIAEAIRRVQELKVQGKIR